jgi:TRAP-type C4-dicarboxylate transport system permease small subunit
MSRDVSAPPAPPNDDPHLIVVTEEEVRIEPHIEDWVAFAIFWIMASVVFLQFFSRYVLNDAFAWTEEIARYLLMWITFVGAAVAMRRRTHIAVEVLHQFLPLPIVRVLNFLIDVVVLGFLVLLAWFAWTVTERMEIQRMTVFDVSMAYVYGGVFVGCVLLVFRAAQMVYANARRGWRPDPARVGLIID